MLCSSPPPFSSWKTSLGPQPATHRLCFAGGGELPSNDSFIVRLQMFHHQVQIKSSKTQPSAMTGWRPREGQQPREHLLQSAWDRTEERFFLLSQGKIPWRKHSVDETEASQMPREPCSWGGSTPSLKRTKTGGSGACLPDWSYQLISLVFKRISK